MHCDVTFFKHLCIVTSCSSTFGSSQVNGNLHLACLPIKSFVTSYMGNIDLCQGDFLSTGMFWEVNVNKRLLFTGHRSIGLGGKRMKIHENQFKCPAQQWLTNKYSKISDNKGPGDFVWLNVSLFYEVSW